MRCASRRLSWGNYSVSAGATQPYSCPAAGVKAMDHPLWTTPNGPRPAPQGKPMPPHRLREGASGKRRLLPATRHVFGRRRWLMANG